ncbi:MAG TPA: hypothetical protein VFH94_10355 [Streptomyces sp.]|nr:hypothetical protein [Streptomyces sp.]
MHRRGFPRPQSILRGLLALCALAALAVGVPALLLAVGTLPTSIPTPHQARAVLLSRDEDGTGLVTTMTVAAWIAWLWLALPVLIETVAVMTRRTTPRLPGMATGQRLAGFLLGSLVLASPAAAAGSASPAIAVTTPYAPVTGPAPSSQTSNPALPTATPKTPQAENTQEFTVGVEDTTWWELAEQLLGDGARYTELQRLNPQVPTTATVLPQGTTLRVPGHAPKPIEAAGTGLRPQLASRTPGTPDGNRVTVAPGDSLSKIAAEELHDADQWPALFEASRGTAQPRGLPRITNPDLIYPGQQVTVPGAPSERPDPGESTEDGSGSTAPAPPPSRPPERPGEGQGASLGPSPTTAPPAKPSDTAPAPAATPPGEKPAPDAGPLDRRTVLGAGSLLAAAVTGALALRRILQRRRRKPGEKITIAKETSRAEAKLAVAAEPTSAARLDTALRTWAHHAPQHNDFDALPPLRAAQIRSRTVEVLPLDPAHQPLAPFVCAAGGWWALDPDAALLDEKAAREVPAPCPGLVTLGSTAAGELVLLNLALLPAVLLDGNPVHITEVCISLALEYAMSPWAGEVEVVAVGFGEDLPQLLPTARIAHMRHPTHALRDLSERLLEAHQTPHTRHQPYLLLCASTLDPDTAEQFADVIDKAGPVPVTLIAPASTAAPHFPDAESLNVSLSTPQQLRAADTEITVQRLEHAAYQQILTTLKVSAQPAHPAEGPWQKVPNEPSSRIQTKPAQPAGPPKTSAPAPGRTEPATSSKVTPATTTNSAVFPALLAATTDPAGVPLRPAAPAFQGGQFGPGPRAMHPAPESPAATETAGGNTATPTHPRTSPAEHGTAPEVTADEDAERDRHAPEIRVLGPVEVTGVDATGHGPRTAQLAALLYFRPGRTANSVCADMDPVHPWSLNTLNARMQGLRRALGNDPDGNPYVPRRKSGEDPYRLSPHVRCDWERFLAVVEHALPVGPPGVTDLEKALRLVRGRPFGGKPRPWAEPHQQEMITRIIDVAHTVASYRTPTGPHHDLSAARQAVATGLDVDDTAELLYRDWCRLEHAAGNRQGLHTAITRIQDINHTLDCSLEPETEELINELLHGARPAARKVRPAAP